MTLTCTILVAAALATGMPAVAPEPAGTTAPRLPGAIAAAPLTRDVQVGPGTVPPAVEGWMVDRAEQRPGALAPMYATFAGLQALDVYSTRRAIGGGAYEANPLMRGAARHTGTMLAVKALASAGTIYFTERAWKKNRKGAVILMAIVNGVSAAVAVRNLRNETR